jgi:hypothetical protein
MKVVTAAAVLVMTAAAAQAAQAAERCLVTDPAGTPLNVRETPGGRVRATLDNGMVVEIAETGTDAKGRRWGRISGGRAVGAIGGWVLYANISCF